MSYDVVVADNYSNSSPEAIKRVEKITGKSIKVYELDIKDAKLLEKVFEENKIDAVIHFAGLKAVGESVKLPVMYYRNNIDTTLSLLETMSKYDVKNIIFSSSVQEHITRPDTKDNIYLFIILVSEFQADHICSRIRISRIVKPPYSS